MRAAFDDTALVEYQYAIRVDHAGQPMGEDQRGTPGHQPVQRLLDYRLVLGVDRREGFVEHQDRRVPQ